MPVERPHDKFVRDIISEKKYAVEIFSQSLPENIVKILDLSTLKLLPGSFIDEEMKEFQSDALFSVKTKEKHPLAVYILFEHKSYPDKKIHFQLLSYLAKIYTRQKSPEPVIPLVFYHGQKTWNIKTNFIELFNFSLMQKSIFGGYIPDFAYEIYDLSKKEIEKIQGSIAIRSLFYLLKKIWDIEKDDNLRDLIKLSKELFYDEDEKKILEKMVIYLYVCTEVSPERLEKIVSEVVSPDKGDIVMTTAEVLEKKGIEKGIEKGKLQDAEKMLKEGLSVELIARVTGLSADKIRSLQK